MASAIRKIGNFLGIMDDEEQLHDHHAENNTQASREIPDARESRLTASEHASSNSFTRSTTNSVRPINTERNFGDRNTSPISHISAVPSRNVSALDIVPLNPRVYSDAKTVGEHYRSGQTVIMNLTEMEDEERRRLVDFAAGLVFGHEGKIERITSKVFLLTPPNVTVSGLEKRAAAETHFFNQS